MSSLLNKAKSAFTSSSVPANHHLAAVLNEKGTPLEITHRATPKPGPDDLLIKVSSIALNPIDYYMRDFGFGLETFPAVVGSDIAGEVVSAGSGVDDSAPKPGTHVAAFAPAFFVKGMPDYGAFQTHVLVPAANATPLPQGMSSDEGALLPMSVVTAMSGWYSIGLTPVAFYKAAEKQGMLVWGGASSIGCGAIQTARLMGFTVYTTASERNHAYLTSLGANECFDYKSENVVASVVETAKANGISLDKAFDAAGALQQCMDILKEFKGDGQASLTSAKPLSDNDPKVDGVKLVFVAAPTEPKQQTEFFYSVMRQWLPIFLQSGDYKPSPKVKLVPGGLEAVNEGLDELKKGVSGTKLVLEL